LFTAGVLVFIDKLRSMAPPAPRFPLCSIFRTPRGQFGFRSWFDGTPPHYEMATFPGAEDALNWIDPHRERAWVDPEDPAGIELLASNAYRPGTVADRVSRAVNLGRR
jgi:hypothetical protein